MFFYLQFSCYIENYFFLESIIINTANPSHHNFQSDQLIVFDIGCRYGLDPSWASLKASDLLVTFSFDADKDEITRLSEKYKKFANYFPICCAFSDIEETKDLNILAHKGQSSFNEPNLFSTWFNTDRRDESTIESKRKMEMITLDQFITDNNIYPDFIKVDTEGYDYKILKGSSKSLSHVLAVRCEIHFEEVFIGSAKFDTILSFMYEKGFVLANIDYFGRGIPQSYFCPNLNRYGLMSSNEAVFIKPESFVSSLSNPYLIFKFILFCFLNNLEDLAFLLLPKHRNKIPHISERLMLAIKKEYLVLTKKFLYIPGDSYIKSCNDFSLIFDEDYPSKHKFFESDLINPE